MLPSYMVSELKLINDITKEAIRHGTNWNNSVKLRSLLQEWIKANNLSQFCRVNNDITFLQIEEIDKK